MYRYITLLLGMKPNEHEYKVMGLAPYCKDKYSEELFKIFKTFQIIKNRKFINLKMPKDNYFYFKKLFQGYRFDIISSALQRYTEFLVVNWVKSFINPKITKNLCFAGGVAMNVKANKKIAELKSINQLYIPPSPDDSSQSAGACYAFCLKNNIKTYPLKNNYLGFRVSNNQSLKRLKGNRYKITTNERYILKKTAKLLSKNKIIAICRGKAEFGARALGNRSIICNPSEYENVKKINKTIKNRDFWMPFAATVIDKYSQKYFEMKKLNTFNYRYMTNCVDTKMKYHEKLKAVLHPYDKTCRPQILTKKENPFYYKLINELGKISKIYAVLNTSLNTHGSPIVNSADDAIELFKKTNLDAIILGNKLIEKKKF
jgi:carbamoyltransferase